MMNHAKLSVSVHCIDFTPQQLRDMLLTFLTEMLDPAYSADVEVEIEETA